jgi:hypothetical protein
LSAFKPLTNGTFFKAGNTICQRYLKGDTVQADVKITIDGMADGEEAGLCNFNGGADYATIGVVQSGTTRTLKFNNTGTVTNGAQVAGTVTTVWFRSKINKQSINTYYYSLDGTMFTQFGGTFALKWGGYRGDYIGIYNYNNTSESGYIDVDWFHYTFAGPTITQVGVKPPKNNSVSFSKKNNVILRLAARTGGTKIKLQDIARSGGRVVLYDSRGRSIPISDINPLEKVLFFNATTSP